MGKHKRTETGENRNQTSEAERRAVAESETQSLHL